MLNIRFSDENILLSEDEHIKHLLHQQTSFAIVNTETDARSGEGPERINLQEK